MAERRGSARWSITTRVLGWRRANLGLLRAVPSTSGVTGSEWRVCRREHAVSPGSTGSVDTSGRT